MRGMLKTVWISCIGLLLACQEPAGIDPAPDEEELVIKDWTDETHGNDVPPDYPTVFPQNQVNTLVIELGSNNWQVIQNNMKALFGYNFGTTQGAGQGGFPQADPEYVPVSVKFNGKEWYKVGFRLKGNSSLSMSWRKGIYKLPFRLNFDRFEDVYPQLKNQRFYGFKELSMAPGVNDESLIREKISGDIFNRAGIASSQTAFYKVYINFGSGLWYCGVYTMVEVVDDTMIESRFGEDDGNIYKPESDFTSFVPDNFEKKNNKAEADFSDVVLLINTLHSPLRTENPAQWREQLEAVFYVDHFMKWLAVNTVMQNWDTYGHMPHNYYLYNHAQQGLTWIPWDNNESLSNRRNTTVTIGLEKINNQWPLIRFLMDDPVYANRYREHMSQFLSEVFTTTAMNNLVDKQYALISPFVIGPYEAEIEKYSHLTSSNAFIAEHALLKQHIATRIQVATEYLEAN